MLSNWSNAQTRGGGAVTKDTANKALKPARYAIVKADCPKQKRIDTLMGKIDQNQDMILQLIMLDSLQQAGQNPEKKIIKKKIKK